MFSFDEATDITPKGRDKLSDVGCSWGRWSIAPAKNGFSVVGIDSSLGAVMAASRLAKAMNLDIKYVVADGRFLPFRNGLFDFVYSYRVARAALLEIGRLLDMGGTAKIQMANK